MLNIGFEGHRPKESLFSDDLDLDFGWSDE